MFWRALGIYLWVTVLLGCAAGGGATPNAAASAQGADAAKYETAKTALLAGEYGQAGAQLEALDALNPPTRRAHQAVLDVALERYKLSDAGPAVQHYIEAHPQTEHLDYAYYLRGLLGFYAGLEAMENAAADAAANANQRGRQAYTDLVALIRQFPNSRFTPDATQRLAQLRNALAQFEIELAKQDLIRRDYATAAQRARYVTDNYSQAPAVQEAALVKMQADAAVAAALPAVAPAAVATPMPRVAQVEPAPRRAAAPAPTRERRGPPGADWLLRLNPQHYTIQLMSLPDEPAVRHAAGQSKAAAYFAFQRGADTWYAMVHGVYPTHAAAVAAARRLPKVPGAGKPWARRIGVIQDIIRASDATTAEVKQ